MVKNKIEIKKFLGMEVRVVNNEYIVLKDMLGALGRLESDGKLSTAHIRKTKEFIEKINLSEGKSFTLTSKGKKKSKESQEFFCVKLEIVPILLTQFEPSKRVGDEALKIWTDFMKFVNDLLVSLEVYKFIVVDKELHKEDMSTLKDAGGNCMISQKQVNGIMAELIGVTPGIKSITKDELKIYQGQTTIDLLEVREFVMKKFINAFEFTGSHKTARAMATKLCKKKFDL